MGFLGFPAGVRSLPQVSAQRGDGRWGTGRQASLDWIPPAQEWGEAGEHGSLWSYRREKRGCPVLLSACLLYDHVGDLTTAQVIPAPPELLNLLDMEKLVCVSMEVYLPATQLRSENPNLNISKLWIKNRLNKKQHKLNLSFLKY